MAKQDKERRNSPNPSNPSKTPRQAPDRGEKNHGNERGMPKVPQSKPPKK